MASMIDSLLENQKKLHKEAKEWRKKEKEKKKREKAKSLPSKKNRISASSSSRPTIPKTNSVAVSSSFQQDSGPSTPSSNRQRLNTNKDKSPWQLREAFKNEPSPTKSCRRTGKIVKSKSMPSPSKSPSTRRKQRETTRDSADDSSEEKSIFDLPPAFAKVNKMAKRQWKSTTPSNSTENRVSDTDTTGGATKRKTKKVKDAPPARSRSVGKYESSSRGRTSSPSSRSQRSLKNTRGKESNATAPARSRSVGKYESASRGRTSSPSGRSLKSMKSSKGGQQNNVAEPVRSGSVGKYDSTSSRGRNTSPVGRSLKSAKRTTAKKNEAPPTRSRSVGKYDSSTRRSSRSQRISEKDNDTAPSRSRSVGKYESSRNASPGRSLRSVRSTEKENNDHTTSEEEKSAAADALKNRLANRFKEIAQLRETQQQGQQPSLVSSKQKKLDLLANNKYSDETAKSPKRQQQLPTIKTGSSHSTKSSKSSGSNGARKPRSLAQPERLAPWQIREQQKHRVTPIGLYGRRPNDDEDDDEDDIGSRFSKVVSSSYSTSSSDNSSQKKQTSDKKVKSASTSSRRTTGTASRFEDTGRQTSGSPKNPVNASIREKARTFGGIPTDEIDLPPAFRTVVKRKKEPIKSVRLG